MSASPEFFKPAAPAFSPTCATQSPLPLVFGAGAGAEDYFRTPTGSGISYLREPTTCPPPPKKPPPPPPMCRKRLFQQAHSQAAQPAGAKGDQHQHQPAEPPVPVVISLRLDELERIFRPHPPPATTTTTTTIDKRRRSSSSSTSASASASDNKQSS